MTAHVEPNGPFIAVATFCDSVIEDKQGTISLIRVIDRVMLAAQGQDVPEVMPARGVDLTLAITLRSGNARGRQTVIVRPEAPSGQQLQEFQLPVLFEGEDRGQNLIMNLRGFPVEEEGLYWFDVLLNDRVLTRVPLRFVYQRIQTA